MGRAYNRSVNVPTGGAVAVVDHVLGNSVGANGWSREPPLRRGGVPAAELGSVLAPALMTISAPFGV